MRINEVKLRHRQLLRREILQTSSSLNHRPSRNNGHCADRYAQGLQILQADKSRKGGVMAFFGFTWRKLAWKILETIQEAQT
jgi:hypothetical protein